eukprot:CAMPEP_0184307708 /NCGR_PEP_ID=MMETSP1049-20130417/16382_1 /TAXON_ID=77928 /ORGANISM="Proteomonas sulcata, Strain CCMP704" /LENGTH=156 /DNA_ID=CAMNT_0026620257 /DNA_START=1036 /DNA_END=1508 /DNA_ORIENTATION=-
MPDSRMTQYCLVLARQTARAGPTVNTCVPFIAQAICLIVAARSRIGSQRAIQALRLVACVRIEEYFPAAQSKQGSNPSTSLYLPPGQAAHSPPFSPTYPRLQVQLSTKAVPGADVDDGGHSVQLSEPEKFLYFPGAHIWQGPPSAPVNPYVHLHSG